MARHMYDQTYLINQCVMEEAGRDLLRHKARSKLRVGNAVERCAVSMAEAGYGFEDIKAECPNIDLSVIRQIVLGIE